MIKWIDDNQIVLGVIAIMFLFCICFQFARSYDIEIQKRVIETERQRIEHLADTMGITPLAACGRDHTAQECKNILR